MSGLSQQMQGKMTLVLNDLRQKTVARMTEAGERIKKRPALKGDDSFTKVQFHHRKATHERPQDKMEFTPKQEAKIRDANAQDLALFEGLGDKLNTLNTYIAQGYTLGLDWNGELIPWEQIEDPKHTMKIDPVEEMKLRAEGLDFIPTAMKPKSFAMTMGA